jgi:hypothetical protein
MTTLMYDWLSYPDKKSPLKDFIELLEPKFPWNST